MEGRNYLEGLQFKKSAKKQPIINIELEKETPKKNTNTALLPKVVPQNKATNIEIEEDEHLPPSKTSHNELQITDLRGKVPVDYELIMKRLQQFNITGVTENMSRPSDIEGSDIQNSIKPPSIVKTIQQTVIDDENIIDKPLEEPSDNEDANEQIALPKVQPIQDLPVKKIIIRRPKINNNIAKDDVPKEPVKKTIRGKSTKKVREDVVNVKLTKADVARRMPKPEKFAVKVSQYYMNNRKMYVQKIRELFKPYEKELSEMGEIASCAKDSTKGEFSLLTHQKIVRDYLNLFTPYRGLLLYHGLGSGKTCTSIGIAEGMKSGKEIIVMTPASLATNFLTEIKKCGDVLYRKNQFWEFVGIEGQPGNIELLSKALSLPISYIEKKTGAWMVDVKKSPNFTELSTSDQESIDEQLDMMIRSKYTDIHYNGLNNRIMDELTQNKTINPFDNKTVIIDEVHNFVSRIVNKLDKKKTDIISKELYQYLLKAQNARIVVLSGTPIINSPHELAVLFNILRGGIRTWTIPVRQTDSKKITKDDILEMFANPPRGIPVVTEHDYVDFMDNKVIITRNPLGFVNTKKKVTANKTGGDGDFSLLGKLFGGKKQTKKLEEKKTRTSKKTTRKNVDKQSNGDYSSYEIVDGIMKIKEVPKLSISKEEDIDYYQRTGQDLHKDGGAKDEFDKYTGIRLDETGTVSDDQFITIVKRILNENGLEVLERMMKDQPVYNIALPDNTDSFEQIFIDDVNKSIKNENVFKRRILGLTSYFRSAQESLLPSFIMNGEKTFHIERVEMSESQLYEYMKKRLSEMKMESNRNKNAKKKTGATEDEENDVSTYRVGSREVSNFSFPDGIERPIPDKKAKPQEDKETEILDELQEDGEEPVESIGLDSIDEEELQETKKYAERVKDVLKKLAYKPERPRTDQYLTKEGMLSDLSPKLLKMMENIQNPTNEGLHLIYSQFRHIEGVGIIKLILEANGYAEFKIKSVSGEESWEIVEKEEDIGKPKFALYTGTESEEEKEIIRNIYNGDWGFVPKSIVDKLQKISSNNLYGEIIKVLMITAAGAEGINLRNTRFVHITEPYWHNTRLEQVIGRARRICSHEQLPEELRTIKVFLYISYIGEELLPKVDSSIQNSDLDPDDPTHVESTDEYLFRIATKKETLNKTFLKAIKESSMDCTLYKNKEGLMCYGVGMTKNPGNNFLSHPTVEEDLADRDDLNVKKTTLKLVELKIEIRGVKYAIDKETDNLYDLTKYKRGEIELIGKLVRPGKGKTGYDIAFSR